MKKQLFTILAVFVAAFLLITNAFGADHGDVDAQNGVTLKDAVLALQVCAGMAPQVSKEADVDGDGRIGLAEAIFALGEVAGGAAGDEFSLGDEGIPDDYDQTVLELSSLIGDYDSFTDELPKSFDWRDQGKVTPAKDQGDCGSCWAFAAVGAMESKILMLDNEEHDLSEQQLASCNREMNGCRGGNAGVLRYYIDAGPMRESCAPYSGNPPTPCDNFNSCDVLPRFMERYYTVKVQKINEIKSSLSLDGPGYFRFDVYKDFYEFWQNEEKGAVYQHKSGWFGGGHAVLIIGWDDFKMAWLCKNSWGKTAGPNRDGTFWLAYGGHEPDLNFGMANARLASDFMLTSPNGGDEWERGKHYTIRWETGGFDGNVKIDLLRGGNFFRTVTDGTDNDGLYTWPTPLDLPAGDDYRIEVAQLGGGGLSDKSDGVFSVVGPLAVLSPNGGEKWLVGSRYEIQWETGTDNNPVNIYLFKEGDGGLWKLKEQAENIGAWSWLAPDTLREGDDYKVVVKMFSNESVFDDSDAGFSIAFPAVAAPSNLFASDGTEPDRVTISWEAATGASYYRVFRNSEMNSGGAVAVSAWQSGTVYADETVEPGATYYYWAKAARTMSGDGASGFSNGDSGYAEGGVEDEFTNSIGMTFRRIPAGTFLMGSPESELGADDDEWPQHEVTLTQDYFMQTTEVTQAQWRTVMGSDPPELYFTNCGDDCPVERVSWNDVQDFIAALNDMDEREYRLPTEAEWEYAARAGTTTAFYSGDITQEFCGLDANLDAIGWYCGNSDSTTHPVAQKQPNAWGLYDMSGNVWEWCRDWYGDYPSGSVTDPAGPSSGPGRVLRGGGWNSYARNCRSANRNGSTADNRNANYGFRLVLPAGR